MNSKPLISIPKNYSPDYAALVPMQSDTEESFFAKLVTEENSDLKVVNAARISFNRQSKTLNNRDIRLINYLAKHNHWTPFAHCVEYFSAKALKLNHSDVYTLVTQAPEVMAGMRIDALANVSASLYALIRALPHLPVNAARVVRARLQRKYPNSFQAFYSQAGAFEPKAHDFHEDVKSTSPCHTYVTVHCRAPIFVARQLAKHQVGMVWNEASRRYIIENLTCFINPELRLSAENVKQGSSEETLPADKAMDFHKRIYNFQKDSLDLYSDLLYNGVAPEIARSQLTQSLCVDWWWTGSKVSFERVFNLRLEASSQKETRQMAALIKAEVDKV